MLRVRATFEKKGRAKYISHLDLNRCMLRTFRRSRIPIWYTEGFNPHPYYSFALALSLGFESSCEILDFNITDDEMSMEAIRDALNAVMPEGMRIVKVAEQKQKITAIAKAEYAFSLVTEDSAALYEASRDTHREKDEKGHKDGRYQARHGVAELHGYGQIGRYHDVSARWHADELQSHAVHRGTEKLYGHRVRARKYPPHGYTLRGQHRFRVGADIIRPCGTKLL